MPRTAVDTYLAGLPEPQRGTLEQVRRTIRALLPAAEEIVSYGVPAYKVDGTAVAGFAGYGDHCSYLPFSGEVVARLAEELSGYRVTKGSVHFAIDKPLPRPLVRKLIRARLDLLP